MMHSGQDFNVQDALEPGKPVPDGKPSALDLAFPSLWLMGGMIFVVAVSLMLMGWKVISLEKERDDVIRIRQRLEEDLQLHAKLAQELPSMVDQRDSLEKSIAQLTREQKIVQLQLDKSSSNLSDVNTQYKDSVAEKENAEHAKNVAGKNAAELKAIIVDLQPKIAAFQQQEKDFVALLGVYESKKKTLESENNALEQKKQKLQAETQGLQDLIGARKKTLESIAQEQGDLQKISVGFQAALDSLKSSGEKAGTTLGALDQGLAKLSEATKTVDKQSVALSETAKTFNQSAAEIKGVEQKLEGGINALASATQAMNDGVRKVQASTVNLDSATVSHTKTAEAFSSTTQSSLTQLQKFIHDSEATGQKIDSTATQLSNNLQAMGQSLMQAKTLVSSLDILAQEAKTVVEGMKHPANALPETVKALDSSRKGLDDGVSRLQGGLSGYLQATDGVKREVEAISKAASSASDLTASMAGQFKNVENLLRDLSSLKTTLAETMNSLRQTMSDLSAQSMSKPVTGPQAAAVPESSPAPAESSSRNHQ